MLNEGERWRVVQGNCFEVMATLPDASMDMVLTDPPYGHNNNNGDLISRWEAALGRGDYIAERDDRPILNDGKEANDLFRACLPHFDRLLARGCCCCCCCCGGGGPDPQFARWSLWMDEVLEFKQMVVWDKGPMGMGWHYRRSYETVLVAQKRGGPCKWYDTSKRIENIIRPGAWGVAKIIPTANEHPTQKPVELMMHFIHLHTQPDDLVLDPFCGSATTGVACLRTGRRFLGIEIDEHYCQTARRRMEQEEMSPQFDGFAGVR